MDLATAQSKLTEYLACLSAISANRSYSIGDRVYTRADLPEVRKTIAWFQRTIEDLKLEAAGVTAPSGTARASWNP